MTQATTVPTDVQLEVATIGRQLIANIERVVRGKRDVITSVVTTVLAGGHVLVEDLPGLGKTTLAKALARSIGGSFKRVQATSDLVPSELTGVNVFVPSSSAWEFRRGPVFTNVLLIDELNRATPRTQSALLEAMAEGQTTVDGTTYTLPTPFFVVATQNPNDHAGTFPLVEGQRDRFLSVVSMGHPDATAERELLLGEGGDGELASLPVVCDHTTLLRAQRRVAAIHLHPTVADYVIAIGAATRSNPAISLGLSPRGALALVRASKARAAISGRDYVTPDDVLATAPFVIPHRLTTTGGTDLDVARRLTEAVLARVVVPRG